MPGFTIPYHINNYFRPDTERPVDVPVSRAQIDAFAEHGYLVCEGLIPPGHVERLRDALDEIAAAELASGITALSPNGQFGGVFLRHVLDKHEAFLELFRFHPTLAIARAMLGPQVQVLPMTARIAYPSDQNQQTQWHTHQRVIPTPRPPFFCEPHVIDTLIYLDDIDEANGPLRVVPGTHKTPDKQPPLDYYSDVPSQVTLMPRAGTCVMIHGNLWHRALPTTIDGSLRRLAVLPYAATWLKLPSYGERPANGLMQQLYEGAEPETLELLGVYEGLY